MNGRDLESSELGLPGENVETPIAIRAPRVKNDVWLAAAAAHFIYCTETPRTRQAKHKGQEQTDI